MRWRDARSANRYALQTRSVDQRAGRPWHTVGDGVAQRLRVLEDASGIVRIERLRAFAKRQRFPRRRSERGRLTAPYTKICRQENFPGLLQPAPIVAEPKLVAAHLGNHPGGSRQETSAHDEVADETAGEMRVAVDRAADCTWRSSPGFETGAPVIDRPADETVDRHR